MTKREFIDEVNDYSELLNFGWEMGLSTTEDVFGDDSLDERVEEEIREILRVDSWVQVYRFLEGIEEGYDYYQYRNGTFEGLHDRDFQDWKDDVFAEVDMDDLWDYEDEDGEAETPAVEEEPAPVERPAPTPAFPEEDFSLFDLIRAAGSELHKAETVEQVPEEVQSLCTLLDMVNTVN